MEKERIWRDRERNKEGERKKLVSVITLIELTEL